MLRTLAPLPSFLSHYEISTPMQSFHMHNEHAKVNNIVSGLKQGKTGAIISDAGTPGIF